MILLNTTATTSNMHLVISFLQKPVPFLVLQIKYSYYILFLVIINESNIAYFLTRDWITNIKPHTPTTNQIPHCISYDSVLGFGKLLLRGMFLIIENLSNIVRFYGKDIMISNSNGAY